jgi:membrane associated rhomboid family serine protease
MATTAQNHGTTAAPPTARWHGFTRELKLQATILLGFIALLWALELVDTVLLQGWLDGFGIRPRSVTGLRGIVLAPLLHGGLRHLVANTVPLLVLGWLVMLRDTRHWFLVGALATLVGGAGVWLFGAASSVHIGASIVVFGFLGYLLFRGVFERRFWPIVGSVVVALLYGGALIGILPGQSGISWEGHLFGFLGGVGGAKLLAKKS